MPFEHSRWILLADIDLGTESSDALRLAVTLPSAVVGGPYVGQLTASGGTEPYLYDDTPAGTVPPGLAIDDTTGAVTGTPTTVGYYEFTASVTDAAPDTVSQVVSIRVTSGIAFSGAFPAGEVGIAYSAGLSAAGGTAPYTWTIPSGVLPTSTSINSGTGIVSGTPSVDGTFNFTVRATDALGNPQDFPTSITIAEALDITTSNYPDGFVGVYYNAGPTVIGGVSPISYAISSGAIPAGTNFSPSTGFVTGTPTTAATCTFDITGTDTLGGVSTTSQSVDITTGGSTSGQAAIQFEDEGSPLGTAGTVDELDFVGAGVIATRGADKVTVTINGTAYTPPVTTKGDLFGFSTVPARLPVGSNGQLLVADSTQTLGLKYDTVTGVGAAKICQIDIYTTAGSTTWNKPANAKLHEIFVVGGGGGGGSGQGGIASGSGAPGGGGGARLHRMLQTSQLGSSETVTVAAGGTGGASVTSLLTGNPGNPGGTSSIGTKYQAFGGGAGGGATNSARPGGGGGGIFGVGTVGVTSPSAGGLGGGQDGNSSSTALNPNTLPYGGAAGGSGQTGVLGTRGGCAVDGPSGGGGGGSGTGNSAGGGSLDCYGVLSAAGGAGGSPTASNGGTVAGINGDWAGCGGGGGGGSLTGNPGSGGAGQQPGGGGGGGGGASTNGKPSGAGGVGGDGIVVIITWF